MIRTAIRVLFTTPLKVFSIHIPGRVKKKWQMPGPVRPTRPIPPPPPPPPPRRPRYPSTEIENILAEAKRDVVKNRIAIEALEDRMEYKGTPPADGYIVVGDHIDGELHYQTGCSGIPPTKRGGDRWDQAKIVEPGGCADAP